MQLQNVLFVDDEPNILNSLKRATAAEPFVSQFAATAEEALALLVEHDFSIVVTDMKMPGKDGLWLLQEAKKHCPDTLRIVLSGYTDLAQVLSTINQGDVFRFITKPWNMERDLLPVLRLGLEYDQLRREKLRQENAQAQRNLVYKKMLQQFSPQLADKQTDLNAHKKVSELILAQLLLHAEKPELTLRQKEKLLLLQTIMADYDATLPTELTPFSVQDLALQLQTYFKVHAAGQQYQLQQQGDLETCYGNWRLLQMLLLTIARLLGKTAANRHLKGLLTTQLYPDRNLARISHVLEFGYVDGGQVLIDQSEWLTYDVLDFYTTLLNKMGSFHQISVTYTYISTQTSMLTLDAQVKLEPQ